MTYFDDENIEDYSRSQSGDVNIVSNHTGYPHVNSANWEHDDTGSLSNYSGCVDDYENAEAEHKGWQKGYDHN
jgi:hypothetical protein